MSRFYWTLKLLKQEALKYKTRGEFQKKNNAAYNSARRKGLLDKICGHMISIRSRMTNKEISKEAKKYNSRSEFERNCKRAYVSAVARGILDKVCGHMKRASNSSYPEKELFNIIKTNFTSTKKLKIRNIKIFRRQYIKGFDIDIFVPELNKGIEMDGTY